ncbi:MAG: DUF5004 domain-containing protein [Bacteroidia bacterium]|nr:DUF5004 domain-containing protein [Bacteroidia bacterium]
MKANRGYLFVIAALMIAFTGCSTYPDGPTISLKSKEARISGTWEITQATDEDGEDATEEFANWRYTFSEDGTAVLNITEGSVSYEMNGDWALSDDQLNFRVTVQGTILGTITFTQDAEYEILRLSDTQFWLKDLEDGDITVSLEPF